MDKRFSLLPLLIATIALFVAGCGGSSPKPPQPGPRVVTTGQSAMGSVHPPGWGAPLPGHPNGLVPPNPTAIRLATMYDSIELGTVPPNPFAVAGYTSGSWPTYGPMRGAWPSSHVVSIAVNTSHHADCLDVEPGDADPSEAAAWVRADIAAGFKRPCLYSSLSPWQTDLFPDLARAGIPRSEYWAWDADYTGSAHLDSGFDATQYTDTCLGRNLDCSIVTLPFLSIAQPPYSPTPPGPTPAQITHWRGARNSSFGAYHHHGCTAGLVHDKSHARDGCFTFAQRVVYFQVKLWTKYARWHVFGPHARKKTLVAWIVRPTASLWSHALTSTEHAYVVGGCAGIAGFGEPSHSKHCRTLHARASYYENHLRAAYGLKPFVF